jgi:MoxR-like ATPase
VALGCSLGRIQFTPDLLPSDVTGTEAYHTNDNLNTLTFQYGPIFHNLVLADEINRAPAKVQAALLEAMAERQVTVAGKSYPLPTPFFVMATQNPIEQEGTYPLPEAQLDRFLIKAVIDYPDEGAELSIIRLARNEEDIEADSSYTSKITIDNIIEARLEIHQLYISSNIEHYIISLIMATRHPERYCSQLASLIEVGASPRASIALDKTARAHAWLQGRDYVDPEDVRAMILPVLRHRIVPSYKAHADGITTDDIINKILKLVAVV